MEENILKKYVINFTQVSNTVLKDNNLSLEAKGMYAYLFSKPDGWCFYLSVIQQELKESKAKIRKSIKELVENNYIKRTQIIKNGRFGGNIYEFLDVDRLNEIPCAEKPNTEKPNTENDNTNNTYIKNNTDIKNNTEINNIYIAGVKNEILDGWNTIAKKYKLPTISIVSEDRKKKLHTILTKYKLTLKEYYDILDDRINKSLFLQGLKQIKDGNGGFVFERSGEWHADFDFFLRESSFVKTMDNKYTDGVFLL